MTKTCTMILALLLSAAVPAAALAQPKPEEKKGAPAAHPAPHAAPHPGPAARPAAPPHPVMRAAPPPRPVTGAAPPPHGAPHPVMRAAPHVPPHPVGRAAPHVVPRQAARHVPHNAPSGARTTHREQRRAQRHTATPRVTAARAKASPAATKAATSLRTSKAATRAARRHERALRGQEDRSVRRLPPSQRAARRAEIRHAREQRSQQRSQQRNQTAPNVQAQPNAQTQRNAQQNGQGRLRRNGQPRVTTQAARQGRFASAFAAPATTAQTNARRHRWSPREAWRHHARAAFIGWYGPVFWPYAYDDVFDYTFWPAAYDDGYWAYAYDDFFDGVFWGEGGPPADYAYGPPPPSASSAPVRYAAVQQLCKEPGRGITAWPIAEIEKKVGLNDEQKKLLAELRSDAQKAADIFKSACPTQNAFPLTPPGRLASMTARVQATLEAVDTVKPALNAFYKSLSDEQKERFNEIGPAPKPSAATTAQASTDTSAPNCKQPKPGLATLPIEKIEDVVKPTDAQEADLNKLQDATDKAVGILQAACPDETPLTPPGRLNAMETRLKAMIDAANTVKPALDGFYASLSNEQKARFNRIGRELASSND